MHAIGMDGAMTEIAKAETRPMIRQGFANVETALSVIESIRLTRVPMSIFVSDDMVIVLYLLTSQLT
ncbi:hypothetical protein RB2654_16571 [Rhodobacterales bacterium HTCC2654]|uniref:Uncharacterized protein n=1 Tax=Maritimibacter alkaliphilus HTCC2654 TaxID=314271 RepID=A3VBG9_9RHOB|nr:hypothetical protein RB2654_16571 [Rhodobacterales bacterium HTCC2654] [Maritimibacter alkaliphilus HTCC2654]